MTEEMRINILAAAGYEAARAWKLGKENIHPAHATDPESTASLPWSLLSEQARQLWRDLVEVLDKNWASYWNEERQVAASAIHSVRYVLSKE